MRKRIVLIIDDEEDFGLLLQKFFHKKNYQVFRSRTLAGGMVLMDSLNPDFIFLDNHLPDGQGWKKKEMILKKYPKAHLNLVSSDHYSGQADPSVDFLEKPITLSQLDHLFQ